ncbi:MAG TPA: DMT family transporter [Chloroflexi bacterium]|nr:DMT family transporter [Chloroflexota bacterium]
MKHSPVPSKDTRPYLGVGLGVLTVSSAAILIRLAQQGAHSLAVAAWRLTLATLILTPIVLATRRKELRTLDRRDWISVAGAGVLLALHFAAWISSLAHTSVAASVVLMSTHPLFVGLASHVFLRERLSRGMVIALIAATAGSMIIGIDDWRQGAGQLWGDLLALMGAISVAGYFLIGRKLRAKLSILTYVFPVYATAACVLMGILFISGMPILPQYRQTWGWLLLMAIGPQILGHSALNWALGYLSATYVTVAILGEPIGSTLLAWRLLDETPGLQTVAGGGMILAGIAIASYTERSKVARAWKRRMGK